MGQSDVDLITLYLGPKNRHPRGSVLIQEMPGFYKKDPSFLGVDALGEKDWLFFIKDNHQRSNSHGVWQSCGANEAVRNATQERIGTKSKFRYYVGNQPTGWFITEYYLDKDYRARANIPERSVDYILCKVEFVGGQQISNSSAAGPSTRVKEETASN